MAYTQAADSAGEWHGPSFASVWAAWQIDSKPQLGG